jgi:hypothetical protein
MAPVVGIAAAAAGSYASSALAVGLFNAGIGLSFGSAIIGGQIGGFLVSTAINQIGSSVFNKKPKSPTFQQDAAGRTQMIRSSVESHKIIYGQTRVSGPVVYITTVDSGPDSNGANQSGDNRFLHMVIPLAGHEVEEIGDIYLNDTLVTLNGGGFATSAPYLSNGLSYVRVQKHLGASSQTVDTMLSTEVPQWDSNHRLNGIAYVYVRMEWNVDIFPTGIPNVSAVVKGKKVYDPRTTLTAWSDNAALCIRDYLVSDYGFYCDADEINDTYFTAAANICDESVTLSGGGTQARYTCNGVVDTAVAPLDNLDQLITSTAGAVTYVQGAFRLHAGAYESPVMDIPTSIYAGELKLRVRTPRKELFNAVRGTYVDPTKGWQPTDFPFVTNSTYETDDGGERIYKDIELPFCNNAERSQRIGKILLEKSRQGLIVNVPVMHHAMKVSVYDVVTLTNAQFGWSAKPFRVLKFATAGTGEIALTLQEDSSASYDWNSGDATTIDAAPDTNLPNPFTVSALTGLAYNSRAIGTVGGDTVYNLVLSWTPSSNMFVQTGGKIEVQFKLTSDTEYRSALIVDGSLSYADLLQTSVNTSYDLRCRQINSLGVKSAWATLTNCVIGSTGGVVSSLDWVNWTTTATAFNDYGDFTTTPTSFNDWGAF